MIRLILLCWMAGFVAFSGLAQDEPDPLEWSPETSPGKLSDEFPKDIVWFNADFPVTISSLHDKAIVVVIWHPRCLEALSYVQKMQELAAIYPQFQVISIFQGDENEPFTSSGILAFVQKAGLNHPVGVVRDVKSFPSIPSENLPAALFYLNSTEPEIAGNGTATLARVLRRMEEIQSQPAAMAALLGWQAKPTVDPKTWADPVIEYPSYLSTPSEGLMAVSEPAHHRVVMISGDGVPGATFGVGMPGYTDGAGFSSQLRNPAGTAIDPVSGQIYIADPGNHRVRVADYNNFLMYTLMGNGKESKSPLDSAKGVLTPIGLPVDVEYDGIKLYVLAAGSNQLFEVDNRTGYGPAIADFPMDREINHCRVTVTKLSSGPGGMYVVMSDGSVWECRRPEGKGNRKWNSREIYRPSDKKGIVSSICAVGSELYVTLPAIHSVASLRDGKIQPVFGTGQPGCADGIGSSAAFEQPSDLVFLNGRLVVLDEGNHSLRMINLKKKMVQTTGFQATESLMFSGDALAGGELLFLEPVILGEGESKLTVKLDLQGWTLVSEGRNQVYAEVYPGLTLQENDITSESFECVINAVSGENYFQVELYLTLRSPDCPELIVSKKTILGIPVEAIAGESNVQEAVYSPHILPR